MTTDSFCRKELTNATQCVDIIFADPGSDKLAEVNETNCFNSTDIGFAEVYTITTKRSGSSDYVTNAAGSLLAGWLPVFFTGLCALLLA